MKHIFILIYLTILPLLGVDSDNLITEVTIFTLHQKMPKNGTEVQVAGSTTSHYVSKKPLVDNLKLVAFAKIYPRDMITLKRGNPELFIKFANTQEKVITDHYVNNAKDRFLLRLRNNDRDEYFETRFPNGPISTITMIGVPSNIEYWNKELNKLLKK